MDPIEKRIEIAEKNWVLGSRAEALGDLQLAYKHFTIAHDLIMDCARLHEKAHKSLRRINLKMGNYAEFVIDSLLHIFAPLGVFELVAYFSKTEAFSAPFCKRNV